MDVSIEIPNLYYRCAHIESGRDYQLPIVRIFVVFSVSTAQYRNLNGTPPAYSLPTYLPTIYPSHSNLCNQI